MPDITALASPPMHLAGRSPTSPVRKHKMPNFYRCRLIVRTPIHRAKGDNTAQCGGRDRIGWRKVRWRTMRKDEGSRFGYAGCTRTIMRDQSACARSIGAYNIKMQGEGPAGITGWLRDALM
ncbi:MAG TPA: hypothetical protein VH593_05175 [Ktedonobacteraceae bacterium]